MSFLGHLTIQNVTVIFCLILGLLSQMFVNMYLKSISKN
jgi:hypothetical protein